MLPELIERDVAGFQVSSIDRVQVGLCPFDTAQKQLSQVRSPIVVFLRVSLDEGGATFTSSEDVPARVLVWLARFANTCRAKSPDNKTSSKYKARESTNNFLLPLAKWLSLARRRERRSSIDMAPFQ